MAREYWSSHEGFSEGFEVPHHGDRGEMDPSSLVPGCPGGPILTISREAGSRGRAIGQRKRRGAQPQRGAREGKRGAGARRGRGRRRS